MYTIHQSSDAELIQAYIDGSKQALEILIHRYKDKIYTTIYMLVKDKYLAEDLFQEAFLKMIHTIQSGRYNEQGKFLPWAVRVAHNLCMDYFRRVKQQVPLTTSDGRDIAALLPFAHENAGASLEKRQTHESLRQLIDILPEEQREIIILRMHGDLSFKEIADLTKVSINTSLGRMRYTLINLRKLIREKQLVMR